MNNKRKVLFIVLPVCVCVFLLLFFNRQTISLSSALSSNWNLSHVPAAFSRLEYDKDNVGFHGEGESFAVVRDDGRTSLEDAVKEDDYQKNGKDMQVTRGTAVTQTEAVGINRIIGLLDPWRVWITEGFEPARDMVYYVIDDEYMPDLEDIDGWLNIQASDGSCLYILQDTDAQRLFILQEIH